MMDGKSTSEVRTRKAIPIKTQLAAALLQLVDRDGYSLIPYSDAKVMTPDQIISLFQRDHYPIRVADGGPDEAWNIQWRLRSEHKRKTATIDQPEMAKQRRIRALEAAHKQAMMVRDDFLCDDCPPTGYPTDKTRCLPCPRRQWKDTPRIAKHPFPKGRKFASQR